MQKYRTFTTISIAVFLAGCNAARTIPTSSGVTPNAVPPAARIVPATGTAPLVVLDTRSHGPVVARDAYGASIPTWFQYTQPFVNPSLQASGMNFVRFPGGSESDAYHWENGGSLCQNMGYIATGSTFANLMTQLAAPLHIDVAVTLNYGSNLACNGGGDPSEAGGWVADAKTLGYTGLRWTVGNEVYGSWEYDLHSKPHDPVTYSDAVRTGYYPAVKNADASAQLGVVVDLPSDTAWNNVVLSQAQPFDFVELHYYPEYNVDSDRKLLGQDVSHFAEYLTQLRAQMTAAGVATSVPIYLGEFNNDAGNEGKQSVSIVNGLFLGQMLGTIIKAGVPMATWWLAYGSCDETGDYSKKLYGWQHYGSEALFSDGLPDPYEGCQNTPQVPAGTPFPTARVLTLYANAIPPGSSVRTVKVASAIARHVRGYGYALTSGYALVLFNNTLSPIAVNAELNGAGKHTFTATLSTYGKKQYDVSKNNRWIGPVTKKLGSVGSQVPLTLPAYSISVLRLAD